MGVKEKENSLQKQVKAYDVLNAKAQTLSAEKDKLTKDKYDLEQKLKKVEYNLSTANGELKTSKATIDTQTKKIATLSAEKDKLSKDKYDLEQKLKKVEYNLS